MGARLTGGWMPLDKHALLRFAKGNRERERGSFDCVPAGRVREPFCVREAPPMTLSLSLDREPVRAFQK